MQCNWNQVNCVWALMRQGKHTLMCIATISIANVCLPWLNNMVGCEHGVNGANDKWMNKLGLKAIGAA